MLDNRSKESLLPYIKNNVNTYNDINLYQSSEDLHVYYYSPEFIQIVGVYTKNLISKNIGVSIIYVNVILIKKIVINNKILCYL